MKKIISILILLSSFFATANGQSQKFVAITIEFQQYKRLDSNKFTHWIIPVDSLKDSFNTEINAFFIDTFTKNNLDDCISGKSINPFILNTTSSFNFRDGYEDELNTLKTILMERRKIQVIKKKYYGGYKEKIIVYATPFEGIVCRCPFYQYDNIDLNYSEKIFLPISDFKRFDDFWKTSKSKHIHIDFSAKNKFLHDW